MKPWPAAAALLALALPAASIASDGAEDRGRPAAEEGAHGRARPPEADARPAPAEHGQPAAAGRRHDRVPPGATPEPDYQRHHLRRPPPGFAWYRDGAEWVLGATGSGLVFDVVPGD